MWKKTTAPFFLAILTKPLIHCIPTSSDQTIASLQVTTYIPEDVFASILEPSIKPSHRLEVSRFLGKLLPLVSQIRPHSKTVLGS